MDIVKKWHVVVDKYCSDPEPEEHVWTVSRDPNETGWTTDSGCYGYGLPKTDAEELANAANEIERLREALRLERQIKDAALALANDLQNQLDRMNGTYGFSVVAALKGDE